MTKPQKSEFEISGWDWFQIAMLPACHNRVGGARAPRETPQEPDYEWDELLDFMGFPHYSNEHRGDQDPLLYEVRTVEYSNIEFGEDKQQLLVIWRPDTPRPTDEQLASALNSVYGSQQ